jgi:cytochrome c-type biogenesis protein CcmH
VKVLLLLAALALGGDGSTPEESGEIPGLPPGPPPAADQVDPRSHALAARLRCPVCQGLSVADSTSEAALIFQKRIHELVAMGYTDDEIVDYFTDRYGKWLLLEPPAQGLDWVIWLAPGLAAGVGLTFATATIFRWRREPDDVPLPSDVGQAPKDPYEARLLAELEDDGD